MVHGGLGFSLAVCVSELGATGEEGICTAVPSGTAASVLEGHWLSSVKKTLMSPCTYSGSYISREWGPVEDLVYIRQDIKHHNREDADLKSEELF